MRWAAHIVSMPDDDVTKQWNAPDAPMFWVGRPNTFILTPLTTADIFKSHLPDIPFTGPLLHSRAKHATNWHIPTEKEVMIVHMISWIVVLLACSHYSPLKHHRYNISLLLLKNVVSTRPHVISSISFICSIRWKQRTLHSKPGLHLFNMRLLTWRKPEMR